MKSVLLVGTWVGLFLGCHLLLAIEPIRRPLRARLGAFGFTLVFSVLAWITLSGAILTYAAHRFEGPAGLGLSTIVAVRWGAAAFIVLGVILALAILAPSEYVASPMALFATGAKEPQGLERISRHPFFAGTVLFVVGHILLSTRLVSLVFFGSFGVLAIFGGLHQDRKLRRVHGEAYDAYLHSTSFLPFWAILRRRQSLVLKELPWLFLGLAGLAAWGLWSLHNTGFAYGAEAAIAFLVFGSLLLFFATYRRNVINQKQQQTNLQMGMR